MSDTGWVGEELERLSDVTGWLQCRPALRSSFVAGSASDAEGRAQRPSGWPGHEQQGGADVRTGADSGSGQDGVVALSRAPERDSERPAVEVRA